VAKKVHILKDKISFEQFALGIVSSNSIFQLVLDINKISTYEFKITQSASNPKKNEKHSYPHGFYALQENLHIHIFKNKNQGQLLFPEASSFDYVLLIRGETISNTGSDIKTKLKQAGNISMISDLNLKSLKNLKDILTTVN
jgi:hypothetical protein